MVVVSRHTRKVAYGVTAVAVIMLAACAGGGGNVNAPRGNSVGSDRYTDFMRVVAQAKTLPAGEHYAHTLPPELRIKNLLAVYVLPGKAYALEFPSIPIDSNPIYVFVAEDVPNPEDVVRAFVADQAAWRFGRRLDEAGWYYVHGP